MIYSSSDYKPMICICFYLEKKVELWNEIRKKIMNALKRKYDDGSDGETKTAEKGFEPTLDK